MSIQSEQKMDQMDQKEQHARIHSKPGSLGDKLGVLTDVTAHKLAPAAEWVRKTVVSVLPESLTHAQWEAEREEQRKQAVLAAAAAGQNVALSPPPPQLPTFKAASSDLGTHIAESITHAVEPLTNKWSGKIADQPEGAGAAAASAEGVPAAAGSRIDVASARATAPVGLDVQAPAAPADPERVQIGQQTSI